MWFTRFATQGPCSLFTWVGSAPQKNTSVNVAPPSRLIASALPPAAYTKSPLPGVHTNCPTASPGGNRCTRAQLLPSSVDRQMPLSVDSWSLRVMASTVFGAPGDTAMSTTHQPPRDPETPNWPGGGSGHTTWFHFWPPSSEAQIFE